ncbi:hypothetical protein BDD12DRAFT_804492 [Trichophaea hybrida]|nr:hypothetical protein BDD12DRAFT_804492 [Trichophaea hybrida]
MVLVEISGLVRDEQDLGKDEGQHTICIDLDWDTEIQHIFRSCFSGFIMPEEIIRLSSYDHSHRSFRSWSQVLDEYPAQKLRIVTNKPSDFVAGEINMDDSFLHFINLEHNEPMTADLSVPTSGGGSEELVIDGLRIKFHRTIRIPDDNRLHQLPKSLGAFSLYNVSAFSERLPEHISETGGVFFPMWQREAMWIQFKSLAKSFAVRVNVGKVNVISGLTLDEKAVKQDYVVIPGQPWLDGIAIEPGVVRQFVAMPLGSGYTVEGQITGDEKFGGFQIEVTPAYQKLGTKSFWCEGHDGNCIDFKESDTPRDCGLEKGKTIFMSPNPRTFYRVPKLQDFLGPEEVPEDIGSLSLTALIIPAPQVYGLGPGEGGGTNSGVRRKLPLVDEEGRINRPHRVASIHSTIIGRHKLSTSNLPMSSDRIRCFQSHPCNVDTIENPQIKSTNGDTDTATKSQLEVMGIAAGGKLIQDLVTDSKPRHVWNTSRTCLTNVHIFSPASFEAVTHIVPYDVPITAKDYADAGLPFFVIEEDPDNRIDGSETLDAVKSVSKMDEQIGVDTSGASSTDTKAPKRVRPCNHQFCFSCVKQVEVQTGQKWRCPAAGCGAEIVRVAGFSAPMNLPGEEAFKVDVPVVLLKVEDGRTRFQSVSKMRI